MIDQRELTILILDRVKKKTLTTLICTIVDNDGPNSVESSYRKFKDPSHKKRLKINII